MESTLTRPPSAMRVLFAAGKLERPRRFANAPCTVGSHAGPMKDTDTFDAAGGIWTERANCGACSSTVSRSEFRAVAS